MANDAPDEVQRWTAKRRVRVQPARAGGDEGDVADRDAVGLRDGKGPLQAVGRHRVCVLSRSSRR